MKILKLPMAKIYIFEIKRKAYAHYSLHMIILIKGLYFLSL